MDFAASPFEIKQLNDAGHIEGIAAAFGNVDHAREKILFGSVTKTLAARGSRPLPMLMCHDLQRPCGAWKDWTEKPDGLYVKGRLTLGSRDGAEAYALAKDGGLTGISIGFNIGVEGHGPTGREIHEIDLHEASLVPVPCNDLARVTAVKSIAGARDIEDLFREGGLSSRRAKAAASAAWKSINYHDDDEAAEAEALAILNASAARIAALGGTR